MKKMLFIICLLYITNIYAQEKRVKIYPFKSAIIEYKYEAQLSGTHIKYIDDYGYKQADYIRKEINLDDTAKEYQTIITIGNRAYSIDLSDSTVSMGINNMYAYYLKYPDRTGVEINDALEASASGWKYTGIKSFLGKECGVWEAGKNIRYRWNSITLYEELYFMMMMVEKATKVDIDVKIPEEIFELPEGLKFSGGTGTQIGFSGMDLDFAKINLVEKEAINKETPNSSKITIESNSADYTNAQNFTFYNIDGDVVNVEGNNDYENYDYMIIKSQEYALLNTEQSLSKYSTAFFKTSKGDYGKMQIVDINDNTFSYQYIIFNEEGLIEEYSSDANNELSGYFKIEPDENHYNLLITPLNNSRLIIIQ